MNTIEFIYIHKLGGNLGNASNIDLPSTGSAVLLLVVVVENNKKNERTGKSRKNLEERWWKNFAFRIG